MAQYTDYSDLTIGTTTGGMTAVTSLQYSGANAGCPPPKTRFQQFVRTRKTADGNLKGLGKPVIRWILDHVPYNAVNALRDLLTDPNPSGTMYITNPDKDGNIQTWECVMQWPADAPAEYEAFDYWERLVLTFERCVQQ